MVEVLSGADTVEGAVVEVVVVAAIFSIVGSTVVVE